MSARIFQSTAVEFEIFKMTEHGLREVPMGRGDTAIYSAGDAVSDRNIEFDHKIEFAEKLAERDGVKHVIRKRVEIKTIITETVYETKV